MAKLTDFTPANADDITDDAVLYLVQNGKDYKVSVDELQKTINPEKPDTIEIVNINW